MTECWNHDGTPNKYNYRHECAKLMQAHAETVPWFGLEQEYTLLDLNDKPYGWPQNVCCSLLGTRRLTAERLTLLFRRVSLLLKAHITAASVLAGWFSAILSRATCAPAFTPASRSRAPTPRSASHNGSSRSALASASAVSCIGCHNLGNSSLT